MGKRRSMIKVAAALITLGYCSLLVYQSGVTFNSQESRSSATVQVSVLTIEPVTTATLNNSVPETINNITLDDIFISVKTSKNYQDTRLPVILKTWFQLAKNQTWFFTDTDNATQQQLTNGHVVNTNCSATHARKHLCCKTSVEYDRYLESGKKWFCHFDDDNYVNVPQLVKVLQRYNYRDDWYLGRNSVKEPLKLSRKISSKATYNFRFLFGTFGAGLCISRSLALKMIPLVSGGRFISICEKLQLPDDVTMGFVIEHLVKTNLTVVPEFHSHYEPMKLLPAEKFKDQISFSYSNSNVLKVPGFDLRYDPTRFFSLHCFLFPHFEFCPR